MTTPAKGASSCSSYQTELGNWSRSWMNYGSEAEAEIDKSYREVVTLKRQEVDKWVSVKRGRGSRQREQSTLVAVLINSKYTVLDTVGGDDLPGTSCSGPVSGTEVGPSTRKGRREEKRAVVIGDSIVRGADGRFCGEDLESRMVCCLPGAGVRDISDRVQVILKREGKSPDVVVHLGTNDVGRMSEGVLRSEFRELGVKLKGRTSRVTISGLLPVPRASEARNRKIVKINTWLRGWCRREGFRFLDNWALFQGRWDLFRRDGLHLNWSSTNILAGKFASASREGFKLNLQGAGIQNAREDSEMKNKGQVGTTRFWNIKCVVEKGEAEQVIRRTHVQRDGLTEHGVECGERISKFRKDNKIQGAYSPVGIQGAGLSTIGSNLNRERRNGLIILYLNARSVRNKADELEAQVQKGNYDVVAITETWL
ncbi:uncharacterized protein LOC132396611 [Hypanus sabinus]|uniref:uncharacterized protein LOC132396611 n=1 Tax=Hypanus sabinus TaxID=79690 RepID=UPI0028C465F4|nr:uncharacterized protein LOC132396611 [Hypanus sabinus]